MATQEPIDTRDSWFWQASLGSFLLLLAYCYKPWRPLNRLAILLATAALLLLVWPRIRRSWSHISCDRCFWGIVGFAALLFVRMLLEGEFHPWPWLLSFSPALYLITLTVPSKAFKIAAGIIFVGFLALTTYRYVYEFSDGNVYNPNLSLMYLTALASLVTLGLPGSLSLVILATFFVLSGAYLFQNLSIIPAYLCAIIAALPHSPTRKAGYLSATFVAAIFLLALFPIPGWVWQRTVAGREALYLQAWQVFLEQPLFGAGFQIPWISLDGVHDLFAHNVILSTLAQCGIAGLLSLLYLVHGFVCRLRGQTFSQRIAGYLLLSWCLLDEPFFSALPLMAFYAQLRPIQDSSLYTPPAS